MFKPSDIKIGIIWRLIEVVGAEFFAFCSFLVLTRLLAPEHFGVVALATLLILVAQLVLYQGVGEALVQIDGVEASWFSSALWMNAGLASLAALVLIVAAPLIADAFSEPRFAPVLRAVAVTSGTSSSSLSTAAPSLFDSSRLVPGSVTALMVRVPSLNSGRKARPIQTNEAIAASSRSAAPARIDLP